MLIRLKNNPIAIILLLTIIMLGFSIGYLPVSIMEARNFITTREMVTDGNWLLTTMNGVARYEKPPLPTWISAVFGLIFGIKNIIALRFPAILFVALTGVGIYLFSNKLLNDKQQGFINALIGITSFYVIGIIIEAPWDIFTHGFMLIAIYYLFHFFQGEKSIQNSLLAGVFIGFSILSKGPISIYALLLPFLIAYGVTYKYQFYKRQLVSIITIISIALIIGGWWYFYIRLHDSETFKAIAAKETGNWASYNVKPFYYYWSFFTQSGIWTIPAFIGLLYPYLKSRVSNLKAYQFSLLWTIVAVVLLSLIPEKKSRYLMPVLIPLAINTGFYITYLIKNFKFIKNTKELFPVYFNFGLIALIGIAFPVSSLFIGPFLGGTSLYWFLLASLVLVTIGILIIIQLKRKNIKMVFYLCIAFIVSILITVLPLSNVQKQDHYNPVSILKEEASKQGINVYSINYIAPEIIWQFGGKIPSIKDENDEIIFPKESTFGILSNKINQEDLTVLEEKYHLEKKTSYDLNTFDTLSKKYNNRLKADYYVVTER